MTADVLARRAGYWMAFLLVLLTLGAAPRVAAQGGASAVVSGVVADTQGGVLPGVTVTLRNEATGTVRTAVSEPNGRYRFGGLQPGRYSLRAELDGFAPAEIASLTLTIGLAATANLSMAVRGLQESVTVTGQAPVVETTRTDVASVVTQEQIEMLPIANRQAGSLALIMPGTQMPTGTRRARPSVGAGGANVNLTTSYVDGGQNQIYNSGQEFLEVPQSGIREFKVNISGSSAQYSAVGGVVLVDTRRIEDCFAAVDYFEHLGLPFVVAVNLFNGVYRHHPREVREALSVPANVPVVLCDARNRLHVKETLVLLVEGAWRRVQTT